MKKKSRWMPLEEAIRQIMESKKCTREEATNMLAFSVEGKKVQVRKVPRAPDRLLPASEAAKAYEQKSESVYMPLGYFISTFGFSPADVQGELVSGRLVVSGDVHVNFSMQIGQDVSADAFRISAKALHEWMFHPETPQHMLDQMITAMRSRSFGKDAAPLVVTRVAPPAGKLT
jgi:hypothetical protein